MPIYEYGCPNGHIFDSVNTIDNRHKTTCPICNGEGQVKDKRNPSPDAMKQCHGCGGTGWITVQEPSPIVPKIDKPYFRTT